MDYVPSNILFVEDEKAHAELTKRKDHASGILLDAPQQTAYLGGMSILQGLKCQVRKDLGYRTIKDRNH